MFPDHIVKLAHDTVETYRKAGKKIATAESCTGGLVTGVLTHIPGSSDVVECGFVTYSNAAKTNLLGVDVETLREHGAVSEETAAYMAVGALEYSDAHVSVAITGIAGPDGGSKDKPVGTVWFGIGVLEGDEINIHTGQYAFDGDREAVRLGAVETALTMLNDILSA